MPRNNNRGKSKRKLVERDGDKILIVTEGNKTEPNYFNCLINEYKIGDKAKVLRRIKHRSSPSLVFKDAKKAQEQEIYENDVGYDKIYCIFDRDQYTNFYDVCKEIKSKEAEGYKAITSIPCIEYWFLLHFTYAASPFHNSKECTKQLKKHIINYTKNYPKICDELIEDKKIKKAIKNAKAVMKGKKQCAPLEKGENDDYNPSTQVHLLVKKLQDLKKS